MNLPTPPKRWKFALLVWVFIYPVITLLSMTLVPFFREFNLPPYMITLVMSLILVPLMAFVYIPFINKKFFYWMRK